MTLWDSLTWQFPPVDFLLQAKETMGGGTPKHLPCANPKLGTIELMMTSQYKNSNKIFREKLQYEVTFDKVQRQDAHKG